VTIGQPGRGVQPPPPPRRGGGDDGTQALGIQYDPTVVDLFCTQAPGLLVYAAAAFDRADLVTVDLAIWRRVQAVNVESALLLAQAFVLVMP
jgi:hypothetical protein